MRRILSVFAVLALCLAAALPVRAETQYPLSQGIVTDLAEVLGEDTAQDLMQLSERMNRASLGSFYVVTRHFLGGTDASAYARALFEAWSLNSDDVLLLMVIGEESYALEAGAAAQTALPRDTQTSLLATHFRGDFLQRKYNEAAADLGMQVASVLARASGSSVSTAGLFGTAAIQSTPRPQQSASSASSASSLWNGMFSMEDYGEEEDWPLDAQYSSRGSFNWRGWLIWALLIYFLFFRKKRSYNFGHAPRGRKR